MSKAHDLKVAHQELRDQAEFDFDRDCEEWFEFVSSHDQEDYVYEIEYRFKTVEGWLEGWFGA